MASIKAQVASATNYVWADRFHENGEPGLIVATKFGTTLALGQDGSWAEYTPKHHDWDTPVYPCEGCTVDGVPNSTYDSTGYYTDSDNWGRKCKILSEPIEHPDCEGTRKVYEYPDGRTYNQGYRAGGTWVDSWWD